MVGCLGHRSSYEVRSDAPGPAGPFAGVPTALALALGAGAGVQLDELIFVFCPGIVWTRIV